MAILNISSSTDRSFPKIVFGVVSASSISSREYQKELGKVEKSPSFTLCSTLYNPKLSNNRIKKVVTKKIENNLLCSFIPWRMMFSLSISRNVLNTLINRINRKNRRNRKVRNALKKVRDGKMANRSIIEDGFAIHTSFCLMEKDKPLVW